MLKRVLPVASILTQLYNKQPLATEQQICDSWTEQHQLHELHAVHRKQHQKLLSHQAKMFCEERNYFCKPFITSILMVRIKDKPLDTKALFSLKHKFQSFIFPKFIFFSFYSLQTRFSPPSFPPLPQTDSTGS